MEGQFVCRNRDCVEYDAGGCKWWTEGRAMVIGPSGVCEAMNNKTDKEEKNSD